MPPETVYRVATLSGGGGGLQRTRTGSAVSADEAVRTAAANATFRSLEGSAWR